MANEFSQEELNHERRCVYPPPPGCSQAAWYASRAPAAAATTTTTTNTNTSSSNNNNNNGLAVVAAAAPIPAPAPAPAAAAAPLPPPPPPPPPAPAAAQPAPRRPWAGAEIDELIARRRRGESFVTIGAALGRTRAACETRAKGLVYKGGP